MRAAGLVAVFLLLCSGLPAASVRSLLYDGNLAYREARFDEALEAYRAAVEQDPESPEAQFDLGAALFRQQNFTAAAAAFERAAQLARKRSDTSLEARSGYNLANALFHSAKTAQSADPRSAVGKLEKSVQFYRQALRLDPEFESARHNIELAKLALRDALERLQQQQQSGGDQQEKESAQRKVAEQARQQEQLNREREELQQQQRQQGGASEENQRNAEELAERQQQLREQTQELAEQLDDPSEQQARENLEKAAREQQQAAENLDQQNLSEAEQAQERASEELQQALDQLNRSSTGGAPDEQESSGRQAAAGQPGDAPQEAGEGTPAQMLQVDPEDLLNLERQYRRVRQSQERGRTRPVEKDW